MAELVAVLADAHPTGDRRPVLALPKRAEVVGNALGQHGHDAVGEIDRIAAIQSLAVERAAGTHVKADVGDGDGDDKAFRIVAGLVGLGENGVVMVLGVGRVDGDEADRAPVLALEALGLHARGAGGFRGLDGFGAEQVGDRMGVDGDEADRLFAVHRAQPLAHLGDRETQAPARKGFDTDEIAVAGLAAIGLGDAEFLVAHLLVHRHDAAAAGARVFAKHAEDALGGARQQLDHAAGIGGTARSA